MNTTQLKYFFTLVRTLNYTTAAEQLYVTQPTLSRSIMALETELDTKLLIRAANGIALTSAGETFYQGISPLYQQYDALLSRVKAIGQGMAGEITIALSMEQQMVSVFSKAIRDFRTEHPNIIFTFYRKPAEQIRESLLGKVIDLAVTLANPSTDPSPLNEMVLTVEPPCLVVPTKLDLPHSISTEECAAFLSQYDLILPLSRPFDPITDDARNAFREMLHMPDADPNILFVKDSSAISLYVAAGLGITLCNQSHSLGLQPGVTMLKIQDADPYRKVLQYHTGFTNPALKSLLTFLKERFSLYGERGSL